jgi:carbon storage regulator
MLVLSRKVGEKIMIGEDIEITISGIDRNKVRIGVVAPRDIPVFRQELLVRGKDGKNANGKKDLSPNAGQGFDQGTEAI